MILINLLPHREAARKRRRELFYAALGVAVAVGGLISGGAYLWLQSQISDQQAVNAQLQTEIQRLDAEIKDISTLQAEISALKARQQAVEDLQADRNLPVHLLSELVVQLPSGVYLKSIKQENQTITLQGVAQSNERVSELLRNLSSNSRWLSRPDLVEIIADTLKISAKEQRRVSNFTIRAGLVRASESAKTGATGSASAPNRGASAP